MSTGERTATKLAFVLVARLQPAPSTYDHSMDPVTISAVIALVDWKKVFKGLAADAASKGAKSLLERFKPDDREKIAKRAIELFIEEFLTELEDKTPLSAAIPGYHDQLGRLIEQAAPDITACVQPETKDIDLGPVERMWSGLKLDALPEDFDWALLAKNYGRDIRKLVKSDPTLRERLNTALLEEQTELQEKSADLLARMAGPDPGFDLTGYRDYLRKKCALLQLSAMHTSTYDRRVNLWSVFVPQSARESAPVRDLPRELLRRLRKEGHLEQEHEEEEEDAKQLRQLYQNSPVSAILDILTRNRLAVVLGDPGSGKTSLLKFLVMRWANQESQTEDPWPVWIDLKEYVQDRRGFLRYCESGCTVFGLDSGQLEKRLRNGSAALYLDGLDEVFDGPTRGLVVEEIAAFGARYGEAPVIVTSRIIGYQPDPLRNAGFVHATLEDFGDAQVSEFLRKWHDASGDDAKDRSRLQSQLERALRDSRAVRELAGNPLLLTMMAILNRNQELPRDRVELYARQAACSCMNGTQVVRFP
jgi:hypothetical protein